MVLLGMKYAFYCIVLHLFMPAKDKISPELSGTFWVNLAADACGMFCR